LPNHGLWGVATIHNYYILSSLQVFFSFF